MPAPLQVSKRCLEMVARAAKILGPPGRAHGPALELVLREWLASRSSRPPHCFAVLGRDFHLVAVGLTPEIAVRAAREALGSPGLPDPTWEGLLVSGCSLVRVALAPSHGGFVDPRSPAFTEWTGPL